MSTNKDVFELGCIYELHLRGASGVEQWPGCEAIRIALPLVTFRQQGGSEFVINTGAPEFIRADLT